MARKTPITVSPDGSTEEKRKPFRRAGKGSGKPPPAEVLSGKDFGPSKRPRGRPLTYTREKADQICALLETGRSLYYICEDLGIHLNTVSGWARDNVDGFAGRYTQSREMGIDRIAEDMIRLSDEARIGVLRKTTASGVEEAEYDMTAHRRLQITTRQWYLSKVAPRKYGDNMRVDMVVTEGLADRVRRALGDD